MNGGDYERKFANLLDRRGYHVMRAPSSGSATKRELPDICFGKSGRLYAGELKATSQNVAYYTTEEVETLESFAEGFDATPLLVARYKQDTTYYAVNPDFARRTDTDNYAVDRDCDTIEMWSG